VFAKGYHQPQVKIISKQEEIGRFQFSFLWQSNTAKSIIMIKNIAKKFKQFYSIKKTTEAVHLNSQLTKQLSYNCFGNKVEYFSVKCALRLSVIVERIPLYILNSLFTSFYLKF
jgi:hypothetical protein